MEIQVEYNITVTDDIKQVVMKKELKTLTNGVAKMPLHSITESFKDDIEHCFNYGFSLGGLNKNE